jgi:hypothetical protein
MRVTVVQEEELDKVNTVHNQPKLRGEHLGRSGALLVLRIRPSGG